MTTKTTTATVECFACATFPDVQCNRCRAERPNAQTLLRNEIARLVREDGLTLAEAEARMGVTHIRVI